METIESAKLKDDVLNYLERARKSHIQSKTVVNGLKISIDKIPLFNECIREMDQEKTLNVHYESGNNFILTITDTGRIFLSEGGYSKRLQKEMATEKQTEADQEKNRELTSLQIKDIKCAKWQSWSAIAISIISLFVAIFK